MKRRIWFQTHRALVLGGMALAVCLLVGCGGADWKRQPGSTVQSATTTANAPPNGGGTPGGEDIVRPDAQAVYVVNSDGSGLRQLFDGRDYDFVDTAPSPAAETLAVLARTSDPPHSSLFMVNVADGSRRDVFDFDGYLTQPVWSPDGTKLLLTVQSATPETPGPPSPPRLPDAHFRIFTVATGAMSAPVDAETGQILGWSRDGSTFYFSAAYTPQSRVAAVNISGLSVRTIVAAPRLFGADLSPDGSRIVYAVQEGTPPAQVSWRISVVNVEGGDGPIEIANLDTASFGVTGLDWSPDGTQIAYGWTGSSGERGIYTVAAVPGAQRRQVTSSSEQYDVQPRWSPDGRWLLADRVGCVACDGGGVQTIVAAADGSSTTPLPSGSDGFSTAEWVPDGAGSFVYAAGDAVWIGKAASGSQTSEVARMPASDFYHLDPAGGRVFFVRSTTAATVVYAIDEDGGPASVLASGDGVAVSDDGQIARPLAGGGIDIASASVVEHLDGDFFGQVANLSREPELAWSPDGQHLALGLGGSPLGALTAFDLHADGTWASRTVDTHAGTHGLRWSPDSRMLAYLADAGAYTVSVAGGQPTLVAPAGASALDWSPDGRSIVLARDDGLQIVAAHGGGDPSRSFTGTGLNVAAVRWAPDGARIVVVAGDGLSVVNVESGAVTKLPGRFVAATWSPDGKRLAYGYTDCSPNFCRQRLATADADGSDARDLMETSGHLLLPVQWTSDGRIIIIAGRRGI